MSVLREDISNRRAIARGGTQSKTIERWLRELLDRITLGDVVDAFTGGDATPSVLDNSQFVTAGSTTITDFDDGVSGQVIHIYRGASDITIAHDGANIATLNSANVTLTAAHPMISFRNESGVWQEIERSDSVITATGGLTKTLAAWMALINALGTTAMSAIGATVAQAANYGAILTAIFAQRASLPTYAALTALTTATGLADARVYYVSARTTAGDGAEGWFRYDASSSTTANGGTILAIDGGGVGRFFRVFTGAMSVKWFGAKGDDSTDDLASFNNTTSAVIAAGGGKIRIPYASGSYRLSAQWAITVSGAENIEIVGDGEWLSKLSFYSQNGLGVYFHSTATTGFIPTFRVNKIGVLTSRKLAGTAIEAEWEAGTVARTFVGRNIFVGADSSREAENEPGVFGAWTSAVVLRDALNWSLSQFEFWGDVYTSATADNQRSQYGLRLLGNSTNGKLSDFLIGECITAVSAEGTTEGVTITNGEAVFVRTGVIHNVAGEPMAQVSNVHINASDKGVWLINSLGSTVSDCTIYANEQMDASSWPAFTGVLIEGATSRNCSVINCEITKEAGRTGDTTTGVAINGGTNHRVDHVSFLGISGNPLTVGISVDMSAATTPVIGETNTYKFVTTKASGTTQTRAEVFPQGRLTLTTAAPVTPSDVTAATTIYYTPYAGNRLPIYNGDEFRTYYFSELSNATAQSSTGKAGPAAVANNSNYDLFVWSDAGTMRLTRGPLWTSDTGRGTGAGTTELVRVEGVLLNAVTITNGPAAQRGTYIGTVRSDGSAQINDSLAKRHCWNMYHRAERTMRVLETTDTWNYSTASYQQANASAANQLDMVRGLDEDGVLAHVNAEAATSGATTRFVRVSIGLDAITSAVGATPGGLVTGNDYFRTVGARYAGVPGLGRHYLTWLEMGDGSDTQTWRGDAGGAQAGIFATVRA